MAAGSVTDKAGDLGLMHRKDHRRGGAGPAERIAHFGDVTDRSPIAAELDRNLGAQKSLLTGDLESLLRKPRVAIDRFHLDRSSFRDSSCPLLERAAMDCKGIVRFFCSCSAKPSFLNVHGSQTPGL